MTATEDRMRKAFDVEHENGRTLVQIAAAVADEMVAEATAELRKQHAEMLAALKLAEDVLSRSPFSTQIWLGGTHPNSGIQRIRAAIAAAEASGMGE